MSEGRARRRPRLTADVVEDAGDWSFLEDATALVEAAASQVAADEDIAPEPASFTLVLSDDENVSTLNGQFRGKPKPTNVL